MSTDDSQVPHLNLCIWHLVCIELLILTVRQSHIRQYLKMAPEKVFCLAFLKMKCPVIV